MAAIFFVCLFCFIVPVDGEVVENVAATTGKVSCPAGEFLYTENSGLALEKLIPPSRIVDKLPGVSSSEECRNACCHVEECNVASFITVDKDIKVCALVSCSESFGCLWESYSQGVVSFLQRKATVTHSKVIVPATTRRPTPTTPTTFTTSATREVTTSTSPSAEHIDDSWWFNPFNWARPAPPVDYPEEKVSPPPKEKTADQNLLDSILNAANKTNSINSNDKTTSAGNDKTTKPNKVTSPKPTDMWAFENEMFGYPKDRTSRPPDVKTSPKDVSPTPQIVNNNNLNAPGVKDKKPPGVFGNIAQPVDGVKSSEMGTSWQEGKPMKLPADQNTTYTVGLAVFLASLGLAGILVLAIHFISKNRQKSRYHLLVEEELHADKQPFLPK